MCLDTGIAEVPDWVIIPQIYMPCLCGMSIPAVPTAQ
jgi:hypothetical protein